jgi:hypothetical protein
VLASTPARVRPGYDVQQVDAFLDQAELKLAAMTAGAPATDQIVMVPAVTTADGQSRQL